MAGESVTKEQARVWLATVIHPLRKSLAVAAQRASSGNWSFRAHLDDFELLRESRDIVPPVYHLNLRHFRAHRPELDAQIQIHDDRLAELRTACRGAFGYLHQQPLLPDWMRPDSSDHDPEWSGRASRG